MTKFATILALFLGMLLFGGCAEGCEVDYYLAACDGPHPAPPPNCPPPPPTETCRGQCVPLPPLDWERPALLWVGSKSEAPQCPSDRAPVVGYTGYAELSPGNPCGDECECEAPTGECGFSELRAHWGTCAAPVGMPIPFSAPAPWDGSCADGITLTEVHSLTAEPLPMEETCKVKKGPPSAPQYAPPRWGTVAFACVGYALEACLDPGTYCVPTAEPPPPGFRQCISKEGEHACPAGSSYKIQHVFFDGFDDLQGCSECSCVPLGGDCSATVAIYEGSCGAQSFPIATLVADTIGSTCSDIPGDAILGSKVAWQIAYEPGICQPRGEEPTGTVELTGPTTFCCQE